MLYMIEILTTMYNCFFFVLPKTVMLYATATVCEQQAACYKDEFQTKARNFSLLQTVHTFSESQGN